jgi:RNA polymerase sigma factor FliA
MAKHRKTRFPSPRKGEQEAFEKLKKWAKNICLKYCSDLPFGLEYDDVIQEAYIGLLDAIRRFDKSRGDFVPFAKDRILSAIRDCCRKNRPGSRATRRFARRRERVIDKYHRTHMQHPSPFEIAELMGLDPEKYRWYDLMCVEISTGTRFAMCESFEFNAEWRVATEEKRQVITLSLLSLSRRHVRILHLYHVQGLTLAQIGKKLGVNESRVSQLRTQALERIRRVLSHLGYGPNTSL